MAESEVLTAPHVLEYPYHRTVGPLLSGFFTGLRDGRVLGVKTPDGRVVVPAVEYDPVTCAALDELVEVGSAGTVTTWSWAPTPRAGQPLDRPFAWALIRLDGSDVPMLHALDTGGDPSAVATGMRVRARWRPAAEREGHMHDIICFEPEDAPAQPPDTTSLPEGAAGEPVRSIRTPIRLEYTYVAGDGQSRFLHAILQRRLTGQRCPACKKVLFVGGGMSNAVCPMCVELLDELVDLAPTGTVTTFCIVNVPFHGQTIEIPYVQANILLDGADGTLMHVIQECSASEVRMGMRVEAVWRPDDELVPSLDSIRHFRPTGEPDASFESYQAFA